jgi:hypothetical protein
VETFDIVWFKDQLDKSGKSTRGLARHVGIDASAASRMLNGQRKMKRPEADKIARFLGQPIEEIIKRAGMDISSEPVSIQLGATIGAQGQVIAIHPRDLPPQLLARAQASIGFDQRGKVAAAQVRADAGPLALWDDAVVLFEETDAIEPAAMGVLSIAKLRDGVVMIGHLEKARKTGEATIRLSSGELREVLLISAAPVLAVLP